MGGSPRVVVSPGQVTPDLDWPGELASLTDSSPYLGPAWLAATEKAMPDLRPWHTIATRARGELAIAAGYILDSPAAADHDPRTYLGWQAASAAAGDLDPESFYPALLLGSPLGYRTEVAYNFWTPALMRAMVSALVPAAFQAGVRCVLAPWIPDSRGNQALADALADGGHSAFWGYEDFIRLDPGGWDAHLAALPPDKRRQISGDLRRAAEAGVRIERAEGTGIRPYLPRIAELICLNRDRNGTGEDPAHIAGMLAALLDSGTDVRAYLGFQDGALMASCVTIRKNHRLFVKWPGFDYAGVGDRSGIYFALVLDVPVRDACAEGLRTVEFGAGAHRARYLRGAQPRTVTTAMVLADPSLREQAAARLDSFGRSRHAAFGDVAEAAPDVPAAAGTGSCRAEG
jgi:predicted N-acyltransferase